MTDKEMVINATQRGCEFIVVAPGTNKRFAVAFISDDGNTLELSSIDGDITIMLDDIDYVYVTAKEAVLLSRKRPTQKKDDDFEVYGEVIGSHDIWVK